MRRKLEIIPHKNAWGWAFSSQAVIGIILSLLYPVIFAVIFSFSDLKFQGLINGSVNWVGFENYAWIFNDSNFFRDLGISFLFAIISTAVQTVIGFLFAFLLFCLKGKLQGFFKTILYLPVILPTAVVSFMFILIFSGEETGILNNLLGLTNPPFQWVSNPVIAFIVIIVINTWRFYGITMVVYLVNMQAVSKEIIESATIEGCTKGQIMTKIILPMVASATTLNIILSMIGGLQSFDLFYLFQTQGNLTTELTPIGLYIFKVGLGAAAESNFKAVFLARSMAMSVLLSIIIAITTIIIRKSFAKAEDF